MSIGRLAPVRRQALKPTAFLKVIIHSRGNSILSESPTKEAASHPFLSDNGNRAERWMLIEQGSLAPKNY